MKKYTVSGFVGDAQSRPIAGVQVSVETGGGTTTAYTDNNGNYRLRLEAGTYEPKALKGGYFPKTAPPLVVDGDEIGPTFALSPAAPATVSGTISFDGAVPASVARLSPGMAASGASFQSVPVARGSLEPEYDGLIVRFREAAKPADRTRSLGRSEVGDYRGVGKNLYHVRVKGDARAAMKELDRDPAVQYVQLNYLNYLCMVPNDPQYQKQWNLSSIDLPGAWDHIRGSSAHVIVAVLDTGIRTNSADLQANIVPGFDVVDNDGDPTDDVTPISDYSHGTHVASTIGAVTDNADGLAGAGWNAKVMPIKVFSNVYGQLGAYDIDIAQGIRKAVDMGARVINMSLGGPVSNPSEHPDVENALQYAHQHNVAIFAAAGNEAEDANYPGTLDYPASSDYAFSVGAVGYSGTRASYSNYGTGLDIMAPGATGAGASTNDWILGYSGSTLVGFAGTSQASPHVAAVASLIFASGISTPDQVYQILRATATPFGDALHYGSGLLNAGAAIHAAMQVPVSLVQPEIYAATLSSTGSWTRLTTPVHADEAGNYTITGIPAYQPNLFIVASIDFDSDGVIEPGEYMGSVSVGSFIESEQRLGVNVVVKRVTGTTSTRLSIWSRLLGRSGGNR